jgi:hypothetical protein
LTNTNLASTEIVGEEGGESKRAQKGSSKFDGDIDTIFENFTLTSTPLNLPCYMIETFSQNKEFFGRKEILDQMGQILLPSHNMIASAEPGTINSVVLYGHPGFGKTEIAVEFVFSHHRKFDAVFWLRAEDETKLDLDFRQIAVKLGLQAPTQSQNPVLTRNLVLQWLSSPKKVLNADGEHAGYEDATWLLVFDNADSPDILPDYIIDSGRGSILITSRDPAAKNLFWQSSMVIDVEKFDPGEGIEFLKRQSRNQHQLEMCREIVKHYDGHPLALAQIAGFVKHEYLSFSDVLDYVRNPDEAPRLFDHNYGVRDIARGTLPVRFEAGISQLPPSSRSLLEILSFLDPDRIQESILIREGKTKYNQARKHLLQSSLVRRNELNNELWMHRVDQEAMKNGLSPQGRTETFQKAIRLIKESWPVVDYPKRHNVDRWPVCEGLFPHVEKLQEYYSQHPDQCTPEVAVDLAMLLQEAAWYVNIVGKGNIRS